MIAEAFIAINVIDVFIILACVAVALLCAVVSVAAVGSKYGPAPFVIFAIIFLVFAIYGPYFRTHTHAHAALARQQIAAEYQGTVTKVSVNDHWAIATVKGCKPQIKHEMRRIHGTYWFAIGIEKKDKNGESYTDYRPIPLKAIALACSQQANYVGDDGVLALG